MPGERSACADGGAQYDSRRVDGKRYLITPGPTPVPPEVVAAEAAPLIHHRSPDFRALLGETLAALKRVFATENDVLLFTGSGTSAMESSVANLLSPGDRVVVASAGNFGERWLKLVRAYGIEPVHVAHEWGERLDPARIGAAAEEGETVAVFVTQSETSTGVVHDIAHRRRAAPDRRAARGRRRLEPGRGRARRRRVGRRRGRLRLAEGADVPARARVRLRLGAGLGARRPLDAAALLPRLAPDRRLAGQERHRLHAAVTIVAALRKALELIESRGSEAIWARNRRLARAAREGVKALGLELFSPDDDSSSMVTAVLMPDGVDGQKCYGVLRDRHGVVLAGGQGPLRGR